MDSLLKKGFSVMRYIIFSLLAFTFLFPDVKAGNLIVNGDFELGLYGFEYNQVKVLNSPKIEELSAELPQIDTTQKKDGKQSLCLFSPIEGSVSIGIPEHKLDANSQYEFSVWCKSNRPDIKIMLLESQAGPVPYKWAFSPYFQTKEDWTQLKFTVKTAATDAPAKGFIVYCRMNAGDKVWFDSFSFKKTGDTDDSKPLWQLGVSLDSKGYKFVKGEDVKGKFQVAYSGKLEERGTLSTISEMLGVSNSGDPVLSWYLEDAEGVKHEIAGASCTVRADKALSEIPFSFKTALNGVFKLKAVLKLKDGTRYDLAVAPKFGVVPANMTVKRGELPVDVGVNFSLFGGWTIGIPTDNTDFKFVPCGISADEQMKFMSELGISIIRPWDGGMPFIWHALEPEEGRYNWAPADIYVELVNKYGLEAFPVIGGMSFVYPESEKFSGHRFPDWQKKKAQIVECPLPQFTRKGRKSMLPDKNDWTRMISDLVGRYKGKIRYYEIMNESNLCMSAPDYVKYMELAWNAAKKADSDVKLVGIGATGDLEGNILSYMRETLKDGAAKYCDYISFHAYDGLLEDSRVPGEKMIQEIKRFMKESGCPEKELWMTELYYLNPKSNNGGSNHEFGPVFHPGYLIRRYLLDASAGVKASICVPGSYMIASTLHDGAFDRYKYSAPLKTKFVPSELYIASASFAYLLNHTEFTGKDELPLQCRAYRFYGKDKAVAAVFGLKMEENENVLTFKEIPSGIEFLDLFANPMEAQFKDGLYRLPVGPVPFYVKSKNSELLESFIKTLVPAARNPVKVLGVRNILDRDGNAQIAVQLVNNRAEKKTLSLEVSSGSAYCTLKESVINCVSLDACTEKIVNVPVKQSEFRGETVPLSFKISGVDDSFNFKLRCNPALKLPSFRKAPDIDGKIDEPEWKDAVSIPLCPSSGNISEKDCSASVKAAYDKENFYLAVTVKDNMIERGADGSLYDKDSIELFFDGKVLSNLDQARLDESPVQLVFAPESGNLSSVLICKNQGIRKSVKWNIRKTQDSYSLELALPFKSLGMNAASGGFGFDIIINDADGKDKKHYLCWSGDTQNWNNRFNFGYLGF